MHACHSKGRNAMFGVEDRRQRLVVGEEAKTSHIGLWNFFIPNTMDKASFSTCA